ncbi:MULTISPECIES: PucR family transcriptional regulator [unclassified Brevibacterium]|uniref:PucR family transcriptional regulator n=1 Tax=unclassified Brevibacterium TaxID=2614124 RepID=UPI0022A97E3F|nr:MULTISPECIES: PucR family transcriptional regulator [unclassified Brevibacterium]MCD1286872.1 CdaR family transcriptional regulator [Brevibacterium sp. CCUG 69071]MDK8433890.1 PucR family transcriptional regulator ligand-binding domain-containing protein [Brevibacterium sp. H-BE7]
MSNDAKDSGRGQQELTFNGRESNIFSSEFLTVADVLELPSMREAKLIAGSAGLDKVVELSNVMEVPDILPWVKPGELLLTTAYPIRDRPEDLAGLLETFDQHGMAAIGLKSGRYLEHIPEAAVSAADALGLPLIHLGENVGFDEIMQDVLTGNLDRRAQVIARTEASMRELVDVVVGGGDLADVCRMLAQWTGVAAAVTTLDGRVRCLRTADEGRSSADVYGLMCFDRSGRFLVEDEPAGVTGQGSQAGGLGRSVPTDELIRHAPASATDESAIAEGMNWGNVVIESGRKPTDDDLPAAKNLGRIVAFGNQTLRADDFRLLEQAAAAAALVITREQAITAVESKYRTDFVLEVLRGHIASTDRVLSHAHSLGWDLDRPISIAVAEVDSDADSTDARNKRTMQALFADAWTKVITQFDPRAAVVGSGDQVIVLLEAESREKITGRMEEFVSAVRGFGGGGRRQFSVGISRPAEGVSRLASAYQEAMRALEVGRQLASGQGLRHYDSLGVYRLLLQVGEQAELRSFAEEVLGPLASDAKAEYAGLRETLQELLDHNLNVAETARALFFHYNTLRYRIGKLEQMVGPFTEDPDLRLSLALALQIVKLP